MSRTGIGKILAIFVAVASIAFMGFAFAVKFGGPDWMKFTRNKDFEGYKIVKREGEAPQWVATQSRDESQVGSSPVLPAVIAKVMDDIQQERQQEISALTAREPELKEKAERLKTTRTLDEPALDAHVQELRKAIKDARDQSNILAQRVLAATAEAQKLENQVSARREDVFRLEAEVNEIRADHFRLTQLRSQLEDLLRQVEGDLDRAKERAQELDAKLNK
jgi:DNA repair exonuclease SbcCD ATPase subunit